MICPEWSYQVHIKVGSGNCTAKLWTVLNSNTPEEFALTLWICQAQQWAGGMVTSPEGKSQPQLGKDQNLTTLQGHWCLHVSDTHVQH